jgi:hypothetical protein
MLWGAGVPMPGPLGKLATDPVSAPPSGSKPATANANESLYNAATQNREIAAEPAAAPAPVASGAESGGIDVDVDGSFEPPAASAAPSPPPKANQPAATVMFESSAGSMIPPLGKVERLPAQAEPASAQTTAEVPEPEPPAEPTSRQTPTKFKSKPLPKKGQKQRPGTPARWGSSQEEAPEPKPSSSKAPIIAIAAVVLIAVIGVSAFFLRGKGKTEQPAKDTAKIVEPVPAQAEPAASEEPAALAAKPTPAAEAKPAPAAKPAVAEHANAAEKPAHADKPAHAEKPSPTEKPSAASTPPEPKVAGGKPSEDDYRRANEAYERGNAKLFQGNTAEAIVEFNEAHKLNPKDPAVHRGLGLAYAQSGKSAEAVKQLKLYLKAFPKAPDRTIIEKRIDQLHGK